MVDTKTINTIVTTGYIVIQASIAVFVSVMGAYHVQRCLKERRTEQQKQLQVNAIAANEDEKVDLESGGAPSTTTQPRIKPTKFFRLWLSTVWKMRSVYGGLAVHSFDVLTDVLVIIQWWHEENNEDIKNVDTKVMAASAIFVFIGSKVISAIAIYIKDRNITRSALQLFDLLIFAELYETHRKVVTQLKSKEMKNKNNKIESTLSFKYVRSFEACFEAIPEAVLQLVYVVRKVESIDPLFAISIAQSIVSMTNSIINNDYTQMQDDRFAEYKQRLPPTVGCVKHMLCRFCEVTYRIGLLALFWTVCGGFNFCVMLLIEFVIIGLRLGVLLREVTEVQFNADTVLLSFTSLVVVPSEQVYAFGEQTWYSLYITSTDTMMSIVYLCVFHCCCFMAYCGICVGFVETFLACNHDAKVTFIPLSRICTSMLEIVFIFIWAYEAEGRYMFLFEPQHGMYILIVTMICYAIYTQYMILFPNFALPFGVSVRSKWGYAYANEIGELQKVQVPKKRIPYNGNVVIDTKEWRGQRINEPLEYQSGVPLRMIDIALLNGHDDVVSFLINRGATQVNSNPELLLPSRKMPERYQYAKDGNLGGLQKYWSKKGNDPSQNIPKDRYKTIQKQDVRYFFVDKEDDFWDEPASFGKVRRQNYRQSGEINVPITPAVFALAKENEAIVQWLEARGATAHVKHNLTVEEAQQIFDNYSYDS
eukprot:572109_1